MFPYEKLEVYKLAVEFSLRVQELAPKIAEFSVSLADDLTRGSESIELNIAEGACHRARKLKAHYYRLARGSVGECSTILKRAERLKYLEVGETTQDQILLNRLSFLLLRIIQSQQDDERSENVRKEESGQEREHA
jgi:four helix bundle protein